MNFASLLDKTVIIVRRDLLTTVRYRTGFLLAAAGAITELAAFYYLSIAVGPDFRPEGFEYFSFLLVGTGFYTFLLMGVHAFLQTVQEAQQTGTLEVLMTTSTSPPVLVFLSAMSAFAANTVTLLFSFDFEKQFRENRLIAVDPPYWGIDLDACTLRVIDSYEVSGTVISNHR